MLWNDHSRDVPDGSHAFLSPSSYAWLNYSDDKLKEVRLNKISAEKGTKLHALACQLIKMKVRLPDIQTTLSMYVNDAIDLKMEPEKKLYYSKFCYGTADAILVGNHTLQIHDLKTGVKIPASFKQLEIYAALFFLEYPYYKPGDMARIELRIYQQNEIRVEFMSVDEVVPIMDRIIRFDKILQLLEENYNE